MERIELNSRLLSKTASIVAGSKEQMKFYSELRSIVEKRNYKPGWAAQIFKARYGSFPPRTWNTLPTTDPTAATRDWIKNYYIKLKDE
jgi:hypothetical protein